jgi:hypothetical protein
MKSNHASIIFVKRAKNNSLSGQRTIMYILCKPDYIQSCKVKATRTPKSTIEKSVSICSQLTGMSLGQYLRETNKFLQSLKEGK